jgi:hypothetical protein
MLVSAAVDEFPGVERPQVRDLMRQGNGQSAAMLAIALESVLRRRPWRRSTQRSIAAPMVQTPESTRQRTEIFEIEVACTVVPGGGIGLC